MAQTPLSNAGSYLPVAEFLKRCDKRSVARLANDLSATDKADVNALVAQLPTNQNLLAALLDASGELESACLVGNRYQPADLAALTGASQGKLYRLLTWMTLCYLYERRPPREKDQPPPWYYDRAREELDRLEHGERVFGFVESAKAGRMTADPISAADVQNQHTTVTQCRRLFGRRGNQWFD
jgi:hypothetical protein